MSSIPLSFAFGIEVELLVRPKEATRSRIEKHGFRNSNNGSQAGRDVNRLAVRKALVEVLGTYNVPAQLNTGTYETWTVADEPVLDERPGYWRCEIISRILKTQGSWRSEIDDVFVAIRKYFDILLTSGCSMHVHVSPAAGALFTASQLKRVLKSVIYYDRALVKVMPPERKQNEFAMPNTRIMPKWTALYNDVPQKTWGRVFDECDKESNTVAMMHRHELGHPAHRYCFWNFRNLMESGTIEFRGPPAVENSDQANHWVAVALGFVSHALVKNWDSLKTAKTYPTSNDVRDAIRFGIQRLDADSQGALRPLPDINQPPVIPSAAERDRIKMKKLALANKTSKFVQKVVNSRPNTPVSVHG